MGGAFWADTLGMLAAICTTAAFVPQAWRVLKTRDTRAISLTMYVVFTIGLALWLAYGIAILSWPVIVANAVTILFALAILAAKIRYG
jgi:MtN3 and saliva related transmembrane protein